MNITLLQMTEEIASLYRITISIKINIYSYINIYISTVSNTAVLKLSHANDM